MEPTRGAAGIVKHLLIFGGNGFIGAEASKLLLKEGYKLTLINRGNWSWDYADSIRPFVKHIFCDRKKPAEAVELFRLLEDPNVQIDAVIDFSAYKSRVVEPFYDALVRAKVSLYIYISSDSVYEVCSVKSNSTVFITEDQAKRPKHPAEAKKLAESDSYGHHKLAVEELLKSRREENGLPYVFLRLPDVLGARDSTDRLWKYLLWLQYAPQLGRKVCIPAEAQNLRTSYVWVQDVARVIASVLRAPAETVVDKVYNVASVDTKTLQELLSDFCTIGFDLQTSENVSEMAERIELIDGDVDSFFPSVTKGPLNISRIKKDLQYEPSDWSKTVRQVAEFYQRAVIDFPHEFEQTARDLFIDLGIRSDDPCRQKFFDATFESKT